MDQAGTEFYFCTGECCCVDPAPDAGFLLINNNPDVVAERLTHKIGRTTPCDPSSNYTYREFSIFEGHGEIDPVQIELEDIPLR